MNPETLLRLESVSKSFGRHVVVDGVDLSVERRSIVTLIGPNGAGKTTLVKLVLGLMNPSAGRIERVKGLRIGYMPQKLDLERSIPLQVDRFLAFAEPDPRLRCEALERTGIGGLAEHPVQGLSGGETQRMLLARALLRKPDLLVLDEPVQGVDVSGQDALYKLISGLRDELGCAVFMVSHDLHLVMAATDQVICLNQHVCCSGSPSQVSVDPEFVALFGPKTALYAHNHDHHHDIHQQGGEEHQVQAGVEGGGQ
ncbi:MAG TPA: zinc ABC transporter ATP-binding protein ZnuC [Porticoccaceae bacterium]|nr:zinc ABC transporter ATP-binding protein ZnuC [Porticoccaceae bacterium]